MPDDDLPKVEPSAAVRQAAKALHQMFVALRDEGFTEQQALSVIATILASQQRGDGQ